MYKMEFSSLVEQNIERMTDKMFGDCDLTLKTITKMTLLDDGTDEFKHKKNYILEKIRKNNEMEMEMILQESFLTYDKDGKIICFPEENPLSSQGEEKIDVNDIDAGET